MLCMDETIITETPPLRAAWALQGHQAEVPITGNRTKRILYGALNPKSGDLLLSESLRWNQVAVQRFFLAIRSHWRGWHIVLFLDKGSPHRREQSPVRPHALLGVALASDHLSRTEPDGTALAIRQADGPGECAPAVHPGIAGGCHRRAGLVDTP